MRVMDFPFIVLTIAGCWPPDSWSSLFKRAIYNVYTITIILLLFSFLLPQIMDIILNVDNADDFTDTFYVMLAMSLACCKIVTLLFNRRNIKILTDTLMEKPFKPLESDEIKTRNKFENIIQNNSIWYALIVEVTCGIMTATSLIIDLWKGELTYREWLPFKYSSGILFYIIYFRQLISLTLASVVNVACDCLICGLLLHICCQIEILQLRLKKFLRGQESLGECVYQHDRIYNYACLINEKFRFVIAIQFTMSMLVVCSNLYRLARTTLSLKYIPLFLYTAAMMVQILIFCWFGNEVKRKSIQLADEIFGMDWITLDQKSKGGLIMIMNRSLVPIEFSSIHIFTMNLDSFVKLLKTSYSLYNILQHM